SRISMTRIAKTVEHGLRVVLLRFVIEDEHDPPFGVQVGVIIITEFRSSDAVTGKDDRRADRHFERETADKILWRFKALLGAAAHELDAHRALIGAIFDQINRL